MAYKNKSKSRKHFGRKEYIETIEGRVKSKTKAGNREKKKKLRKKKKKEILTLTSVM